MHHLYKLLTFFCVLTFIHILGFFVLQMLGIKSLTDWKDLLVMPAIITFITSLGYSFTKTINKASKITAVFFLLLYGSFVTLELLHPSNHLEGGWDYFIREFNTAICSFFLLLNRLFHFTRLDNINLYWILSVYLINVFGLSFYIFLIGKITSKLYSKIEKRFTTQK